MTNDIYTYIFDNFNIKVTDYQFKRDYILNPLQKIGKSHSYELPYKEDVEYLYITINFTKEKLCKILNIKCCNTILKKLNIIKPLYKIIENTNKTILDKNGGVHYFQTKDFKNKSIKTNIEKRGVEYHQQTQEWKNNLLKTNNEKYGVDNVFQMLYVKEKSKQTNLERYGVEYYVQSDEYKQLYNNKEWVSEIQEKIYETKNKNNSLNVSKTENDLFNLLVSKFPLTINQYHSDIYPFNCDFYIPELDLYIEYNGTWHHGGEPYIGTNKQIEKVKLWEQKAQETNFKGKHKSQYKRAINIWTIEDVLKRTTAKQNNLNYLEFFTMDEFNKWFEEIKNPLN